jgi:hypothetical protein
MQEFKHSSSHNVQQAMASHRNQQTASNWEVSQLLKANKLFQRELVTRCASWCALHTFHKEGLSATLCVVLQNSAAGLAQRLDSTSMCGNCGGP